MCFCITHLIFSLQEGHFTHDSNLGLLKPILGSTPGCLHELLNLVKQVREADLFKQSSEVFDPQRHLVVLLWRKVVLSALMNLTRCDAM